jgi:serine/threonine protein kinase
MSYCLNPICKAPQNPDGIDTCQACGTPLQLGDRYRALSIIGQGGFGRTFLAVDHATPNRDRCVIKQFFLLSVDPAHLEKATDLFRQEAEQLKELGHHPQIPNLLNYLEQDGQQYLIQEFVDGKNLAQSDHPWDEASIEQLLTDLLPVLQYIHEHQVIHRDIKPANIIRQSIDQKLFLVDLGAAKSATGTALAKTGTVIGSAEFTAPEQARGKATFASDLYSLGATCIALLTQLSPFDLYDVSDDRWVWQDYLTEPVSDRLAQILNKMLQNATNRRYGSAKAVLQDLQKPESQESSQALKNPELSPLELPTVEFRDPEIDRKKLSYTVAATQAPIIPAPTEETVHHPARSFLSSYYGSPQFVNRRLARIWLVLIGLVFLGSGAIFVANSQQSSSPPTTEIGR